MNPPSPEANPQSGSNAPIAVHAGWWRRVFHDSDEAQLICRIDGTVTEFNGRAAELLGLDGLQADATSRLQQALTPATVTRLVGFLSQEPGTPIVLSSITLLGGAQLGMIADLQITPLGGSSALLTIRDATRRWRMESQMQRLMAAVDATPELVILTDSESKLIYVNPAFQTMTGYKPEAVLGRTPDFMRAPSEGKLIESYMAHVGAGLNWQGELTNLRANGTAYSVAASISPIFDKSGARIGFVSFERDISPIQSLQEELRAEHDYSSSIINSLDSAIYTTDLALRLSQINEGWKKMPTEHGWLTLDRPPQAGQPLLDLIRDPARRDEVRTLCQQVLAEGRLHELSATSADGRQWLVRIAPWLQDGESRGVLYVVSDQTEFHQLQQQLNQSQKVETVGTLAGGVAHGFNNLLHIVRGYAGMALSSSEFPPSLRAPLQQIDDAAARGADIARQLLNYARDTRTADAIIEFNKAVADAAKLFEGELRAGIQLKVEPAPLAISVRLDSARLNQVMQCLLRNAQEAMPGGGTITISSQTTKLSEAQATRTGKHAGAEFIRCRVADTGTGIPSAILPRIFDPFFTTKEPGKALGFGLAFVHSLVAQADGFVEVTSQPGRGSNFDVLLPVVATASASKPAPEPKKSKGRVLVVDDVDLVLEFTSTLLRDAGFEVFTATEADDAMKVLNEQPAPVDLIFTDYNLGGKTGVDLMNESSARWPGIQFIISSGFLEEFERRRIEKHGARILEKPFKIDVAIRMIREMLEARPRT